MLKILVPSFVFTMSTITTAFASPARELRVAIIDFPPFYGRDADNQSTGILSQRAEKVLTLAGYKMKPIFVPAKRMAHEISSGSIHVWMGASGFPEFKKNALISNELFMEMNLSLWALKSSDLPADFLNDTKRAVIIFGYSYGGLATTMHASFATPAIEAKTIEQALLILRKGRAHYIVNYNAPMDHWLQSRPEEVLHSRIIKSIPCHIVVSRHTPGAEKVMRDLEEALRKEKASLPSLLRRQLNARVTI